MKIVYLDNNATTQVAPEVLEAMLPYFHDLYGNPSSAHSFGGQIAGKIREAREQVAGLLGALPEHAQRKDAYCHEPGGASGRPVPVQLPGQ